MYIIASHRCIPIVKALPQIDRVEEHKITLTVLSPP